MFSSSVTQSPITLPAIYAPTKCLGIARAEAVSRKSCSNTSRPVSLCVSGQPYVIVFCGVNGVGKSTNLAKIAYWLGSQGLTVQLAACDTFRAGAVEQLKTHAAKLGGVSAGGWAKGHASGGRGWGGGLLDEARGGGTRARQRRWQRVRCCWVAGPGAAT